MPHRESDLVLRVLTPEDWPVWRALRLVALETDPARIRARTTWWPSSGVARRDGERDLWAGPRHPELISMWVAPGARGRDESLWTP
jgi:hypothetical protein